MPYFAITGRLHGEDEDTAEVYQCETLEQARQMFIDEQRRAFGVELEDLDCEIANVYITTCFRSETKIEVV